MKRKVRIYKDPFGNGGYINKTAQWLRKAQEGAETGMTPVTAGIMQQMQAAQPQQMQQQTQQPSQDEMLNTVVSLAQQGYGKDDITNHLISQYGVEEGTQEYSDLESQIQVYVDGVFQQIDASAEEDTNYNDEGEDTISQMVESQDTYSDEQDDSGYDINDDIMVDFMNEPSEAEYDYGDEEEYKYGGIPNKRSYINKTIRQLRKAQQGGDQVEEANTANVRGTENNPTTNSPGNKNTFISGVKNQAQDHFLKQQAEQMYNSQFGQGMIDQQDGMDYAQRGGWKMRRGNRKLFGSPNLPFGVTSSKYSFGPLGGVRSAEVQFNPLMMASMFPMMTFPGMGGFSSWSYNQPYTKKSTGRIVIEKIATVLNNKSTEDIAKATDSDAAKKSAEGPCTEEQVKDPNSPCYDPMYTGEGPRATNTNTSTNTTVSNNTSNDSASSSTTPVVTNTNTATNKPVVSTPSRNTPVVSTPDVPDTTAEDALRDELNAGDFKHNKNRKDAVYVVKDGKYYIAPNYNNEDAGTEKWYEVTDPERIKNIKKLKGNQEKQSQSLEGKKGFNYSRNLWGEWEYYDIKNNKDGVVTNKETLKKLNSGKSKGNVAVTLESKPGYYYRVDNAGNYIKFKGDPKNHSSKKTPVSKITKKSNPEAWNMITKSGKRTGDYLQFQEGGSINNPFEDQYGSLQKFIYGDEVDDVMLNALNQPINQTDLDYTDSKDTTDPYFKHGGLHRFQGTGDSQTNPTNTGKTYNQEEVDKMIAEKQKSWETDYQTKAQQQQQQQMQQYQAMQQYMNPMASGASGYGYRGAPMGGFGGYGGPGLLGAAGRLAGSFMGGRQSQFSPVGNPLQYAATAAGITKAGMLPTRMKYNKQKKEDGNFFERKLGFNKDKVWTIDYATPDQIKSGAIPGAAGTNTQPGTTPRANQDTSNLSGRDKRIAGRDERLNRNTPAEADAYEFTSTLTGSTEPQQPSKSAEQELIDFQANQRKQGLMLDPKTQKWVKGDSPLNNIMTSPGMSRSQEANLVTGTPGISVGTLPSQGKASAPVPNNAQFNEAMSNMMDIGEYSGNAPAYLNRPDASQAVSQNPVTFQSPKSVWDPSNLIRPEVEPKSAPQSNLGPVGIRSTGMTGKSAEEIRRAYASGTSNPTVINRGNTTYINAAGEPIDVNDPTYSDEYAYGGFIPNYMAYGGYLPTADNGINFSTVSYAGNPVIGVEESPTWGAMQYFNQNQNIKNPDADKFKTYTTEPEGEDLTSCTDEQKKDPTSKCYEPQTAQLKIKEQKGPAGQKAANIMGSALDAGALLADDMNYATERRTKYIPGMTEFAMGEKQAAEERINKGEWNARTGKEGIQGFEGVIRKGGAIKNKKSKASGHKINISDFQDLMRLAGLK